MIASMDAIATPEVETKKRRHSESEDGEAADSLASTGPTTVSEPVASVALVKSEETSITKPKAKRARKAPCEGNGHFYMFWKIQHSTKTQEELDQQQEDVELKAINNIDVVIESIRSDPTSIAFRLNKSMNLQQVKTLFINVDHIECEKVDRIPVAEYRKLVRAGKKDNISSEKKTSKPRFQPTNSYYTFSVVGETEEERHRNAAKVVGMIAIDAPEKSQSKKTSATKAQQLHHHRHGIQDLHFLTRDTKTGCLSVSNRGGNSFDPVEFFDGVLADITSCDRDAYSKMIKNRTMRCQIRSWFAIGPFFDGCLENIEEKLGKSVCFYNIFANDVGVFQFSDDNLSITPIEACKAMGAMHKSLCFQVRGDIIKSTLTKLQDVEVLSSGGVLKTRSVWKSNTKRASRYLQFQSTTEDKKITDDDILAVVNSENFVQSFLYDTNRDFGITDCKKKHVPNTIKIGTNLEWTSITGKQFDSLKTRRGMNHLRVMRKGKADSFHSILSTHFSFEGVPREGVETMMARPRVEILKAIKYAPEDGGEELYKGVVKTTTCAKSCNLCPTSCDNVHPLGKLAYEFALENLLDFGQLDTDYTSPPKCEKIP